MKTRTYRKRTGKEWTPERRAAAAKRAEAQQPWVKSTGPTSADGKAVTAQNALVHGKCSTVYRAELARFYALLKGVKAQTRALDISMQKCINGGQMDAVPVKDK